MKLPSIYGTNKRGKQYNRRITRLANGFSKHFAGHCPDKWLPLAVYGTFDPSARQKFDRCWITIQHPIDKDFTKRVMVLSKNRSKYLDRMPKEFRNRIGWKQKSLVTQ